MNALHSQKLPLDDTLEQHLNNCLTCRACEASCPSGVKYGYLIDKTRQHINSNQAQTKDAGRFALRHILSRRSRLRFIGFFLWLYQIIGLRKLGQILHVFSRSQRLKRLDEFLPKAQLPGHWKTYYKPQAKHKKDIALFLGCATENLDPNTLRASIKLLTHLGYGVHIPKTQNCCGALPQHNGEHSIAITWMKNNAETFTSQRYTEVISVATGCTSMLSEYNEHMEQKITWQSLDIMDFLIRENALANAQFTPLEQVIAVHNPCSMTNVLKLKQTTQQLLAYIPRIQLHDLESNNICCGAAGSYMLSHPEMADRLRSQKLNDIREIAPDIIVSTNIGCALHISAGLRKEHKPLAVIHPIELLARQLSS